MKRCPTCNRIEMDDSLAFCRADGSPLEVETIISEAETSALPQITNAGISRNTGPTRVLAPPPKATSVARSQGGGGRGTMIAIVVIVTAVVAAASVIGVTSYLSGKRETPIDSIAVLPFQNRSSDTDTEYLSDGLAESLIYRLSQLPNLKVSPTSSVMRYKGKETDAIRIGNELGVNAVMSGRMVQRGDNLTISVELTDVRNNKVLWGEQYERKLADLLATQREIATEITQK